VVIEAVADAQDLRDWANLKAQAKLLLGEGKKPKEVARDLGLGVQTIYRWRRSWQRGA
jgi:transposase